jgi:phosphoribosylglycinamide formyltransferase 1
MKKKRIAILASGSGTNAENIILHFKDHKNITVSLILSNNPNAGVLERAKKLGITSVVFNRSDLNETGKVLDILEQANIGFIVLAGFLWLIPKNILNAYKGKIINIHPALLPKYGGKGMYGDKVHQAVIDNKELETGITIHYVNEEYDQGDIIFQAKCTIDPLKETVDEIAHKVHQLEYTHYPIIIQKLLNK